MNNDKIECRTCQVCKNPFLRTDIHIGMAGGFNVTVRGGNVCDNCQEKIRGAIFGEPTGLTGIWFEEDGPNKG